MTRVFAVLACLALTSCVQSPVPLESGDKVTDPRLIGTWKSDLDGDPMVATIYREADGDFVADLQAYSEPGPRAATTRYQLVLAKFGEHRYVSIRDPKLAPDYVITRYVFEGGDRFCLHPVPTDKLAEDLERKVLAGRIKPDRHIPTAELGASTEKLREYFAAHSPEALDEHPLLAFERVPAAILPPPQTQEERDRDEPGFNEVTPCRP